MTKSNSNKPDGFQEITNTILSYIEENNELPWRSKSWKRDSFPVNFKGESYHGGNFFHLAMISMQDEHNASRWLTWNQASKLGGKIVKGEAKNYKRVVYYKQLNISAEKSSTGKAVSIPMAKWYCVYNVSQIEGLPEDYYNLPILNDNSPIESAEKLISSLPAKLVIEDCTPHFTPSKDEIHMPEMSRFEKSEFYYSTLAHEYIHWTGGIGRLDRFELNHKPTRDEYAFEELVAELGAAFLLPMLGIEPLIDEDHAPYIKHWYEKLKSDKKYFFQASTKAIKAVEYLMELSQKDSLESNLLKEVS